MTPAFDMQPRLDGPRVCLRPLVTADRDALHAAASDPRTWAGHPARDRWQRAVFDPYFEFLLAAGGTLAIRETGTGRVIGCSRFYEAPDRPGEIAIGFTFLDRAFWGGGTNFEVKRLMLGHAFARFDTVWFHIAPTNIRSQTATGRLGAVHDHDADLALTGTPAATMCWRLDREAWARALAARKAMA